MKKIELVDYVNLGYYPDRPTLEVRPELGGRLLDRLNLKGARWFVPSNCKSSTVLFSLRATFDQQERGARMLQASDKIEVPLNMLDPNKRAALEARGPGSMRHVVYLFRTGVMQVRVELDDGKQPLLRGM